MKPTADLGPYLTRDDGTVDAVVPGVLVARGFHLGNVIRISTPEGAVIVDTTGDEDSASRARRALDAVDTKPCVYVVYTHGHNDHVGGTPAFVGEETRDVVAHDRLPEIRRRENIHLSRWFSWVKSHQMGRPVEAGGGYYGAGGQYVEPTLTFQSELDLRVGNLSLHLEHTQGETADHLMVWIPDWSVLCCGDLYYAAFPNLSTPALGPRPIEGWIRSLERFEELAPEHLVPGHGEAVSGRDRVRHVLRTYRDAIAHVWDAAIDALNRGMPVDEAARSIRLPDSLAAESHLAELYGTVNWGVRAVYDTLTGWYDGDAASLDPLPRRVLDTEIVAAAGAPTLVDRARAATARGEHQLALELTAVVLAVDPGSAEANRVRAETCRALLAEASSANAKGFYLSGALIAESRLKSREQR